MSEAVFEIILRRVVDAQSEHELLFQGGDPTDSVASAPLERTESLVVAGKYKRSRSIIEFEDSSMHQLFRRKRMPAIGDENWAQYLTSKFVRSVKAKHARLMWRRLGFLFAVAKPTLRDARMRAANRAYAPGGHGFRECERHFDIACGRGN